MAASCQVAGCVQLGGEKGVRFFSFPRKNDERRRLWIKAIRLHGGHNDDGDWLPDDDDAAVCSKHFISGRPNPARSHPDYVPSIFPEARNQTGPRSGFSDVTELYDVKYNVKKGDIFFREAVLRCWDLRSNESRALRPRPKSYLVDNRPKSPGFKFPDLSFMHVHKPYLAL